MADTTVNVVKEVDMRKLAEKMSQSSNGRENIDDSFYICDVGDIALKHRLWMELFPRIHPYFAIKSCTYEPLIRCLMAMGTGFGCASIDEIKLLLEMGVNPGNIVFYNPCKQASHIRHAKSKGVKMVVADSETELLKLKLHYPTAEILLRMRSFDSPTSAQPSNKKFGAAYECCRSLLDAARNLQLVVVGISFHVKSGFQDPSIFTETLKRARKVLDYSKEIGFDLNTLDIGGGFTGLATEALTEEISDTIRDTLNELFPQRVFKSLRIIAMPGRYYPASAFALVSQVIGKRREQIVNGNEEGDEKIEYFINDGIHGAFSTFRHASDPTKNIMKYSPLLDPADNQQRSSRIWGSSYDSLDLVLDDCKMPELCVGDWIFWENAGAYTLPMCGGLYGYKKRIYNFISNRELNLLQNLSGNVNISTIRFQNA